MDVRRDAGWASASERTMDMAEIRKCIGSARFGIAAHGAPVEDFPHQPSQKDGLGRMCKTHWNQYTAGLARDAKARKAAAAGETVAESTVAPSDVTNPTEAQAAGLDPVRKRTRPARCVAPDDGSRVDAG